MNDDRRARFLPAGDDADMPVFAAQPPRSAILPHCQDTNGLTGGQESPATKPQLMALAWTYREEVIRVWRRKGLTLDDAEDCFIEAVLRITGVQKESQIRQSLHRAMSWAVNDLWKRRQQFQKLKTFFDNRQSSNLNQWVGPDRFDNKETDTVLFLESIIKQIPDEYQQALVLRATGQEVDEIAEQLKIHKFAFKSRYHRAQKMARQIAGEGKYSA